MNDRHNPVLSLQLPIQTPATSRQRTTREPTKSNSLYKAIQKEDKRRTQSLLEKRIPCIQLSVNECPLLIETPSMVHGRKGVYGVMSWCQYKNAWSQKLSIPPPMDGQQRFCWGGSLYMKSFIRLQKPLTP